MHIALFVFLVVFGSTSHAKITTPTPPTQPTLPIVSGSVTVASLGPEQKDALKSELLKLKQERTEARALLPPASRLDRIYQQSEVDYKASPIRRSLASLPASGTISVRFVVDPEGRPEEIEILSSPTSQEAIVNKAVSTWLFVPARKSGKRVRVSTTVSIRMGEN
jgi:TonB family protein